MLFTLVGCSNDGPENSKKENLDIEGGQQNSTVSGDNEVKSKSKESHEKRELFHGIMYRLFLRYNLYIIIVLSFLLML